MTHRPAHIPQLDALRGLGLLGVIFVHEWWTPAKLSPAGQQLLDRTTWEPWLAQSGNLAVGVFFMMSAVLLWWPFTAAAQAGEQTSVRDYAIRRVMRILPGYWLALGAIAIWQSSPGVLEGPDWWKFWTLTQNLWSDTAIAGIGPAWTLAVEMQFYLLLGLAALARRRMGPSIRPDLLFGAGMIAVAALWRLFVMGGTDHANRETASLYLSLPTNLDFFGLGIIIVTLTVHWSRTGQPMPAWLRSPSKLFWGGVAAFLAGVPILTLTDGPFALGRQEYLGRCWLLLLVSGLLVSAFAFHPGARSLPHRMLGAKRLVLLGRWSFGAYLWHIALFSGLSMAAFQLTNEENFAFWLVCGYGLSILVGAASWNYLERPAMKLAERLIKALTTRDEERRAWARAGLPAAAHAGQGAFARLSPALGTIGAIAVIVALVSLVDGKGTPVQPAPALAATGAPDYAVAAATEAVGVNDGENGTPSAPAPQPAVAPDGALAAAPAVAADPAAAAAPVTTTAAPATTTTTRPASTRSTSSSGTTSSGSTSSGSTSSGSTSSGSTSTPAAQPAQAKIAPGTPAALANLARPAKVSVSFGKAPAAGMPRELVLSPPPGTKSKGKIVDVHGGGWAKTTTALQTVNAVAQVEYAKRGFKVVVASFRKGRTGYEDLKKRVTSIARTSPTLCVTGGSSGGHLAILLSRLSGVDCVIAQESAVDLSPPSDALQEERVQITRAKAAFGSNLKPYDPSAAPGATRARVLIVGASQDPTTPIRRMKAFKSAAGSKVQLVEVPSGSGQQLQWLHTKVNQSGAVCAAQRLFRFLGAIGRTSVGGRC